MTVDEQLLDRGLIMVVFEPEGRDSILESVDEIKKRMVEEAK